jgi:alpha-beta hydrolase superfamily lysophospholipase
MINKESIFYDSRAPERKIHAVKWEPQGDPKAILIIAHGMGEHIERYDAFATYLAEKGILVAGCDHLGHGKSVGGQAEFGYFCHRDPVTVLVRDVHRLKKMIQEQHPAIPQIIMGHSMGSFIVRNYLFRYGKGIDAAILMGTGMPPRFLLGCSRFIAAVQAIFVGEEKQGLFLNKITFSGYNKRITEPISAFSWLSFNTDNVEAYDDDPLCGFVFSINGFRTLFDMINRLYQAKNLAQIPKDKPILIISGAEDAVGEYGKGPFKTKKSLQSVGIENVSMKLYPWGRHEILHEVEREEAYKDIYEWLLEETDIKQ